ncbi:MAG: HAD-IA family hydrolase [Deltaproteobacteria bacterium]|nr:HAD-IA family hydrolase [Deltaproteobacteria bacterium]
MRFFRDVKLIVFDLDGTIADTAPDICCTLNQAMNKWGLSPYSVEEVKRFVGNGAAILIQRALRGRAAELKKMGISNTPDDPALHDRFFADHMSFYRISDNARTTLYEGVVRFLKTANVPLALYTNKPGVPTERLLAHFDIAHYFAMILHADNVKKHKPDPSGLLQIMNAIGVLPEHTLMVGDGIPDIRVAKAAGCRSVAMLHGNTSEADLRALGPDAVAANFTEFVALIR